jgi:hypothetical protein
MVLVRAGDAEAEKGAKCQVPSKNTLPVLVVRRIAAEHQLIWPRVLRISAAAGEFGLICKARCKCFRAAARLFCF